MVVLQLITIDLRLFAYTDSTCNFIVDRSKRITSDFCLYPADDISFFWLNHPLRTGNHG
jgi:hypothetical protein